MHSYRACSSYWSVAGGSNENTCDMPVGPPDSSRCSLGSAIFRQQFGGASSIANTVVYTGNIECGNPGGG